MVLLMDSKPCVTYAVNGSLEIPIITTVCCMGIDVLDYAVFVDGSVDSFSRENL